MKHNTHTRGLSTKLITLALGLINGLFLTSIASGEYLIDQAYDLTRPIYEYPTLNLELLKDPDYGIECNNRRDEKREVIEGNLTLVTPNDFEKYRCVRQVTGHVTVEPNWDVERLVIPWLETVGGNLILEASIANVKALLPKLYRVSGRIEVNNRQATALWSAGRLKNHKGEFRVVAGVHNKLSGFNTLSSVGKLRLSNHPNDIWGPFIFSGLDGLTTASRVEIDLPVGSTQGTFLPQLSAVSGDVEIVLADSGLFGLSALETIGGNLEVRDSPYTYNLNMFSNLLTLGGLILEDNGLNDVSALSHLGLLSSDPIRITNNYSLGNCNAKTLVRQLRNDLNFNSFNTSTTTVYGNGYPDC